MTVLGIPLLLVRQAAVPPGGRSRPPLPLTGFEGDLPVRVHVSASNRVIDLPLEEYVKGVVAAEMPAEFHPEALRAQAVAARTYAVNHMKVFGGEGCREHPEADVCADPAAGQAWLSGADLRRKWGFLRFPRHWRKVSEAVEATRGLVIVYEQRPIDAVFHAASGGRTEDAEQVWGRPVPYLRSVSSPDLGNKYDATRSTFTLPEVASRTGVEAASLERLRRLGREPLAVLDRTPSGRAALVRVGDREMTGREFRQALGLNSALFSLRLAGDRVEVTSSGYGHGVGMSQYGAQALALQGKSFDAILRHYYAGVEIRPLFAE